VNQSNLMRDFVWAAESPCDACVSGPRAEPAEPET
jgi:hypothetical protein